jgi:TonB-dependent SusC/RagA subfamily outer membrane receptor
MPGAQVSITALELGVLTDNRGQYLLLNVPVGTHSVSTQYIGFGTETEEVVITAGESVVVDFELRTRVIDVEGIVVTGTAGGAQRREVGNSINQINAAAIEAAPVADVMDILQGRSAGTMVFDAAGQAGVGSMIRLRGNNSPDRNNAPLIYVDGIRIYGDAYNAPQEANNAGHSILDIDPADIERVEIIKGAAASTLYGTQASGGVIQIFTKRGASGAPQWTAAIDQGFNNMPWIGPDKDINPTGLGMFDCTEFPGCPKSGQWIQNGHVQNYRLSVRGGSDVLTYYLSGTLGREEGVVSPQHSDDYSLRANFGFSPRQDLQVRFNTSYAKRGTRWYPDGDNFDGHTLNVFRFDADYTPDHDDSVILEKIVWSHTDHFTTGLNLSYTQTPNLTHRLNVGMDFAEIDNTATDPWGYVMTPLGYRENEFERNTTWTVDYVGSWDYQLTGDLESKLSFGGQLFDEARWELEGDGYDFSGPGDKVVDSGARTTATENRRTLAQGGFFVQEMLGFWDRLYITGGVRVDGHSSFGEDFGWEWYPKVSGAYNISDHSFWPTWWEEMKLRAALGVSGRAPGAFDALRTWEPVAGDDAQPGVTPDNIGDRKLGPERTREIEVGFEGNMLDARVALDFTYYWQKTTETLIGVEQVPSEGIPGTQLKNVGQVDNWGMEAMVDVNFIRRPNVDWTMGFRLATHENEVIDLGGPEQISNSIVVGYPLPRRRDEIITNPHEVGVEPEYERGYIGPQYPTWSWGINTNLVLWRGVTLDAVGEFFGGHWMTGGVAYGNSYRGVWPGCEDEYAEYEANGIQNLTALQLARCIRAYRQSGAWTTKGDFFKLRSASINFQIPERFLVGGIRSASFRLSGRNIFKITDSHWLDPEGGEDQSFRNELGRSEWYNLPPYRTFLASLQVNF